MKTIDMKTIGLLGGMSWESTASYYKALNIGLKQALGGLHSAKVSLISVDFHDIALLQQQGDWQSASTILSSEAQRVEASGAECLLICTNTMHKIAEDIQANINIPLLHIADATGAKLKKDKIKKVGLLGTKFTMMEDFYKGRIKEKFNIHAIVPNEADQTIVHNIIYDELCQGVIKAESKQAYLSIIEKLVEHGAEGIILGCTEIGLLVQQTDTEAPLYDTTQIHVDAAIDWALNTNDITQFR